MSDEFKTAEEAESMLRDLNKGARYCTGEKSSQRMRERIREVELERDRLTELERESGQGSR